MRILNLLHDLVTRISSAILCTYTLKAIETDNPRSDTTNLQSKIRFSVLHSITTTIIIPSLYSTFHPSNPNIHTRGKPPPPSFPQIPLQHKAGRIDSWHSPKRWVSEPSHPVNNKKRKQIRGVLRRNMSMDGGLYHGLFLKFLYPKRWGGVCGRDPGIFFFF